MQGIVWILVGEGGLATTLTIEIATDVQLIDRVQGITAKIPQSFCSHICGGLEPRHKA